MIRAGIYPFRALLPRGPLVMGSDFAGTVATAGAGVDDLGPGRRVFGMQRTLGGFGAFAEFIAVRRTLVAPIPDQINDVQAAALPLAALTAWQALFRCAGIGVGERVLITGASGGVGAFAVQLAVAAGARVTGVCSAANRTYVSGLGAVNVLDYERPRFAADAPPWDVVFDAAGRWTGAWFRGHMRAGGRFVTTVPRLADVAAALASPLLGMLRPDRPAARIVLVRAGGEPLMDIARRAGEGSLIPHIDTVYPLTEIDRALDHSCTMHVRGKLVLRIAERT
jgi:NADPH:quinone reductase-like Zn-dependent oxidoreductase